MFTYIRKPVGPKGARQGCVCCEREGGGRGRGRDSTERSPGGCSAAPAREGLSPSSSAPGKQKKTVRAKNGEAGTSGGSSQLEGGGVGVRRGSERGLPFQMLFPHEVP